MRGRSGIAVALALLALAPAATAWEQFGGAANRNPVLVAPEEPYDVVWNGSLGLEDGELVSMFRGPGIVTSGATAYVLVFSAFGGQCTLASWDIVERTRGPDLPLTGCAFGRLVGLDPPRNAVIVCTFASADTPVLIAYDVRDGTRLWDVVPTRDLGVAPVPGDPESWACDGGAMKDGILYVAIPTRLPGGTVFTVQLPAAARHVIAAIDLETGASIWATQVPYSVLVSDARTPVGAPVDAGEFQPVSVAVGTSGLVVTGYTDCRCGDRASIDTGGQREIQLAAAWLDKDGNVVGGMVAQTDARDPASSIERVPGGSWSSSFSDARAAFALGGSVHLVTPADQAPLASTPIQTVERLTAWMNYHPPVWAGGLVLIPLPHSLTAYDPQDLTSVWAWPEPADGSMTSVLTTSAGEILIFSARARDDDGDGQAYFSRIDAATGILRQRVLLPGVVPFFDGGWTARTAAAARDTILVIDVLGQMYVLAPADERARPTLSVSDEYPAPGDAIVVGVFAPPDRTLVQWTAAWGDGQLETLEPDATTSHVFGAAGPVALGVSAHYSDGTTATVVRRIDVGGTPPPDLTAVQRAFAPENQNLTFGVLGIGITVLGAVYTVARHRRRFAKLERELAAVEEIRMVSIEDPRAAVLSLRAYRDRLPQDLARRRIDDSQYQVLDVRSARLLKVLRTRMFAPFDARLSMRYHRLLDAAFEDAILQPSERMALIAALDHEDALRAGDQEAIVAILDDFTSARSEPVYRSAGVDR